MSEKLAIDGGRPAITVGLPGRTPFGAEEEALVRCLSREVERSLDGSPVVTSSTYDVLGQLVEMEDAVGIPWSWEYDSLGRRTDEHDPDAGHWIHAYDDAGRLETQTDAKGQVTQLDYDAVGRLETRTTLDGTVVYSYGEPRGSYSNVGRLTTVTSPADVLRMDYDALGRSVRLRRTTLPG